MSTNVTLPIIHLPGGLHIVVGGFVEIDDSDQKSVKLTYMGGGTRTLDEKQSEEFLTMVGLKTPTLVKPAPASIFTRNR